ncbi:head-tail connector protein [Bacillus subtilis]|uniref:head-tail connector protein n=1 Tax=Bacillus subtilis TaxID=1423 RepID=UPI00093488AE|nr:head-tail connector protein [Bacillus subtilis]MDR4182447.1 phage gp6-like head-tail connector protein [Bacillus subtilis]NCT23836.1 phage gp6-like head-tail connector protein [Bacillus subtilis subsp. subtilis]URM20531.1 phage gp6-like head-tail connector protein [Bacillus subtilis]
MHRLLDNLKQHLKIEYEDEDNLLSFYLTAAENYVKNADGHGDEYLIILVAGIFAEYRVTEKSMGQALESITPLIVQSAICSGDEDESSGV